MLRIVEEIQQSSRLVIEGCYRTFLEQSRDPEDREYPDVEDQSREVLIHGNYMSQKDIEICAGYSIEDLCDYDCFAEMKALHECIRKIHKNHSEL